MVLSKQLKAIVFIVLFVQSLLNFAQEQPQKQIFERIVQHEFVNGSNYIQCLRLKTYFDKESFKSQNNSDIPENILIELEEASKQSADTSWNNELFEDQMILGFLSNSTCLTKSECEDLFDKTGERQRIVSISDPIFDLSEKHCIVSIAYWRFKGSAHGHSYFLKKVYGKWTVIFTYDTWMS